MVLLRCLLPAAWQEYSHPAKDTCFAMRAVGSFDVGCSWDRSSQMPFAAVLSVTAVTEAFAACRAWRNEVGRTRVHGACLAAARVAGIDEETRGLQESLICVDGRDCRDR